LEPASTSHERSVRATRGPIPTLASGVVVVVSRSSNERGIS
jgi:hypothetical protein